MFWGRLHRMILAELLKVFTLALIALTGLILMAGVVSEAMKSGLGPAQVLAAIPLLVPGLLPYTVPTTTLFATCIVYGRLSADSEIIALKAAGVHILHVIWPALLLGALASAVTLFLYLDAIPYASFLLRNQIASDVEEVLYACLRKDGCIRHPKVNYEIHAKNIQGRTLQDVVFKRRAPDGNGFDLVASAKEAELRVDLQQGQLLIDMRRCEIVQQNNVGVFEKNTWPVDIPAFITGSTLKLRAMDMTWSELFAYEEKIDQEKQKISRQIDGHRRAIQRGKGQPHFEEHIRDLSNERAALDNQIFSIRVESHMRPALALGCLFFALVGCPVGIWFSKSDYLSAFITCFLPIVTVYYPLMFCALNMARAGKILPCLAAYDADALMLLAGIILFRRLARN